MRTMEILVGTDGTATSRAAVQWAAREAQRRHWLLRIVHAFDWNWQAARYDSGTEYIDVSRQLADAVVAEASAQARTIAPTVQIEYDTLIGNPAPRLLAAVEGADLAVLGSRGRGGFASLLPPPLWMAGVPVAGYSTPTKDTDERQRVDELLAPWRQKYPDVKVDVMVSHEGPAAVLTAVSHSAQLVVVGSHGHGGIAGALLGSTGIQLLHHADCPVLIARPRANQPG
jgi:nucleotide-binding universal stress UspA family protein